MAESLTEAWAAGRNSYVIDTLAFRGIIDVDAQLLRFQVAPLNSQVWADWLTVDATGQVTIAGLLLSGFVTGSGTPGTLPMWDASGTNLIDTLITHGLGPGAEVTINTNLFVTGLLFISGFQIPESLGRQFTVSEYPGGSGIAAGTGLFGADGAALNVLSLFSQNQVGSGVELLAMDTGTGTMWPLVRVLNQAGEPLLDLCPDGTPARFGGPARLKGYTVATLPASPVVGDTAYVTDALLPTYGAVVAGTGAVVVPVFYNGVAWITA